jgi:hypothetical protein
MVEIGPEPPRRDGGLQIRVRGADQPHVGGLGARAAQSPDRALLDGGEELGLQRLGELANLVEEEHTAVRGLKEAGLGVARVGEGAALEAEQLGLQEGLGNRGAVDVDERRLAPRAGSMKRPGDQALAATRLALEENRRQPLTGALPGEEPAQRLPHLVHRRALAEQLRKLIHDRAP